MKALRLCTLPIALALLVVACSSSDISTEADDDTTSTTATTVTTTTESTTTTASTTTLIAPTSSAPTTTTTAPVSHAPFPPDEFGGYWFQSPSGNIGCYVTPGDGARCDIMERTYADPPRPADCDLDFGNAFYIESTGPARLGCYGDTVFDPGTPVLAYGATLQAGGIECSSAETGMTCRSVESGRGFTVRRASYQLF